MKGRAAPWPGGSWREAEGIGGQSLGLGWGDLGAQAAKASAPADPSQRQESPPPCWERGSCRDVRSKHLRTSGSINCSQGPVSQGVWEVRCSSSGGPVCSHRGGHQALSPEGVPSVLLGQGWLMLQRRLSTSMSNKQVEE